MESSQDVPHRRFNILTQSWILCSPHRAKRPWLGQLEKNQIGSLPTYDPSCYLCPNNKRSNEGKSGETPVNPNYDGTYAFVNDFSALLPPITINQEESNTELKKDNGDSDELLISEEVNGICKVICFSPRHDLTLAEMEVKDIVKVIETWKREYEDIGNNNKQSIKYVQIFENKGAVMGCSNPHPHCQIWASSFIPKEPQQELDSMKTYYEKKHKCMLCNYLTTELSKKSRLVCENERFLVVVPYWALWPFEVLLISKKHIGNLSQFDNDDILLYADMLKKITTKYDNLFQTSFPYSSGIHQSPSNIESSSNSSHDKYFHFHMHFYPPLLRSSTVKKFMVGYEMLAEPQRDITAEQSASRLRDLSDTVHYKSNNNNNSN